MVDSSSTSDSTLMIDSGSIDIGIFSSSAGVTQAGSSMAGENIRHRDADDADADTSVSLSGSTKDKFVQIKKNLIITYHRFDESIQFFHSSSCEKTFV